MTPPKAKTRKPKADPVPAVSAAGPTPGKVTKLPPHDIGEFPGLPTPAPPAPPDAPETQEKAKPSPGVFVAYHYTTKDGHSGFANQFVRDMFDFREAVVVRSMEEYLRKEQDMTKVVIINWKQVENC